jgi:hypothetical protein
VFEAQPLFHAYLLHPNLYKFKELTIKKRRKRARKNEIKKRSANNAILNCKTKLKHNNNAMLCAIFSELRWNLQTTANI